jgi:RNA polymerase sigma-70 factor (ECF subfamily)
MDDREHFDEQLLQRLIQRVGLGDLEAFAQLFEHYRAYIRRQVAARMGPDLRRKVDASDVLQETYLTASRHIGDFQGRTPEAFFQWLLVVANRRLTDTYRRYFGFEKRDIRREWAGEGMGVGSSADGWEELLRDAMPAPLEEVSRRELRQRLRAALAVLPEHYCEVLHLRYFEGLKLDEIGKRLGKSKGAVAMLLSRAAEKLRALLPEVSMP